ncbi:hypothetical protein BDY17DRAFT_298166 [Neohortaea acidophila]|uniref:Transcription initiation factor TFIID subunit 2 n=1 Tax=Neohortaea acidophila TaxID=245834 RepID=A0A6A6PQK6_9PEZI|nr:uncharacterized protein BDY17DRAFT_298166 [Neohortaea acidophila]KAF2482225.1 hypothetical protein BDY17DRAFT_298166 [Neohortaea acidophila]
MAPSLEEVVAAEGPAPVSEETELSILKQKVDLDIDFAARSVKGSTEITILPLINDVKVVKLHCRQCSVTSIEVGGIRAKWEYTDPYQRLQMPYQSTVHQHGLLKDKIAQSLRPTPAPELTVTLPAKLIKELQAQPLQAGNGEKLDVASGAPLLAPIKITIEFGVHTFRDGLQWIGCAEGDRRYPYMYTKAELLPGNTSCIFPCIDDATTRCSWEISIRTPRTLGDAFRLPKHPESNQAHANGTSATSATGAANAANGTGVSSHASDHYLVDLAEDEAALELTVVCVGDLVDDVVDSDDDTRHTVSFNLAQPVAARHIGFAIGPFEHVDLSAARESEEEERLGQTAIKVEGFCLPGQSKELLNTSYTIAWAVDNMAIKYGSFPFTTYQMLFVDDLVPDTMATAGLSFCSARLLFPKTIIEPIYRNTRILIRALADQWMGVNVIAKEAADHWVVAGIAGFMTDAYMKDLCGNNEFRWQQKLAAEKVYELDVDRPSMVTLGQLYHLDHTIREFVNVKSALVLFILDRRLMKTTGQTGVQRIINKIFLNARTGALNNGELSTLDFQRTCERLGHHKLESFFRQWVFQSGCPIFYATQRFNKKKLVVEMSIVQKQLERVTKPPFEPSNFMREVKEHVNDVWAPETNPVFTGPMTIRIHEADGTPYEHIVEIKEAVTKLEIPYNTKYKRLKRSRRQKERQMAEGVNVEGGEDALLFCLGDKYQTEEEKNEWNLVDWTEEDEEKMGQESYEWIRMDADFEWIGKIHLVMPLYMYVSQLQQDRDIVAQYESMRYLLGSNPHHVSLSILVRTLMDDKYFWGIREMAAEGLAICAKDRWREIGQFHLMKAFRELFCIAGTNMPKSNFFSDRRNFIIQCAIPKAMAQLRDEDGKVPLEIRRFFVDLLKFNDNSNNTIHDDDNESAIISDSHYIATLMTCLSDSLIASHREVQPTYSFNFDEDEPMEAEDHSDVEFQHLAIAQIERHRRIDEWDPSYHNVYSVTALGCLQELTKAGIVKDKTKELMQYVRSGNAESVRLAAWRCLSEIGVLRKMSALSYLLHCLGADNSASFRDGLLIVLGEALGHIALGDPEPVKAPPQPMADAGLIIEHEPSAEAKRLEATRKTTPDGALVALKATLENESSFKDALWDATTSTDLSMEEVAALCDIAALVYEPVDSHIVSLTLPRMWRCKNMGQGQIKFIPHGKYRTEPRKGLSLPHWQKMQQLDLKYAGRLSKEVHDKQKEDIQQQAQLKLMIAKKEQELQAKIAAQEAAIPAAAPPQLPTPTTEKARIKLNFGVKRKQSMDLDAPGGAGSPKAPKLSRQPTPTESVASPNRKGSPAGNRKRSTTPAARSAAGKPKGSRTVILRLGRNAAEAQRILLSSPRPQNGATIVPPSITQPSRSITPTVPPSSSFPAFQSPTNSMNYFDTPVVADAASNLGLFRTYGPAPVADAPAAAIKSESVETVETPVGIQNDIPSTADVADVKMEEPSAVESKPAMPPPPRPKLTLKLGSRKSTGDAGSPA